MLDQKLIREDPTFVEKKLSRRGKTFELSNLHQLTLNIKETDIELTNLQSESKKLSKLIGEIYQQNNDSAPDDFNKIKDQANNLKAKISNLEIKKRDLIKAVSELVPLSRTAKEQIDQLKEWSSTGRARQAS